MVDTEGEEEEEDTEEVVVVGKAVAPTAEGSETEAATAATEGMRAGGEAAAPRST